MEMVSTRVHFRGLFGHEWCFESSQNCTSSRWVQFENFQNITTGHKSLNARASSYDLLFIYLFIYLFIIYSTKSLHHFVPKATSVLHSDLFLHSITHLCFRHWPIRNAVFCWVCNKLWYDMLVLTVDSVERALIGYSNSGYPLLFTSEQFTRNLRPKML